MIAGVMSTGEVADGGCSDLFLEMTRNNSLSSIEPSKLRYAAWRERKLDLKNYRTKLTAINLEPKRSGSQVCMVPLQTVLEDESGC